MGSLETCTHIILRPRLIIIIIIHFHCWNLFYFLDIVMGSEQPIHIKTSACCSAGDGEDNDEMKEMLGIMVFPFVSVQVQHMHP